MFSMQSIQLLYMKTVQIIHNPTAGDASQTKQKLISMAEEAGYEPVYISTDDKNWRDFAKDNPDMILLAGGDGTIRKVAGALLTRKAIDQKIPIVLYPSGTANNVAATLNIPRAASQVLQNWKKENLKNFDCGRLTDLGEREFFLEGIGFGVFPALIREMKRQNYPDMLPQEKIHKALNHLFTIVQDYEPTKVKIHLEDFKISGHFLLVEVMNIKSIGPNLALATHADPGDGLFDIVMIGEHKRDLFARYLQQVLKGEEAGITPDDFVQTIRASRLSLKSKCNDLHVDDALVDDPESEPINVEIIPGGLQFVRGKIAL